MYTARCEPQLRTRSDDTKIITLTMEAEPTNLYADTVEPVYRSTPREVFYIELQVAPELWSDDFGSAGGAYVNCYVDADAPTGRASRAIARIQTRS